MSEQRLCTLYKLRPLQKRARLHIAAGQQRPELLHAHLLHLFPVSKHTFVVGTALCHAHSITEQVRLTGDRRRTVAHNQQD